MQLDIDSYRIAGLGEASGILICTYVVIRLCIHDLPTFINCVHELLLTLGACAARVMVVVLCVYLSVTMLAATYLVFESKLWCCKVPYDVLNA